MKPNIIINGIQLDTYLRMYNIKTELNIIKFKQNYSLDNFVEEVNTNIFYQDEDIKVEDIVFRLNTTEQEKDIITKALNRLKFKVR